MGVADNGAERKTKREGTRRFGVTRKTDCILKASRKGQDECTGVNSCRSRHASSISN